MLLHKILFLAHTVNFCYWRLCDPWSSCRKPVDLSWAKHEMQNQECSEFTELLVKKGLTQKDTLIHALIHVSSSSQYLIGSSVTVINIIKIILHWASYWTFKPPKCFRMLRINFFSLFTQKPWQKSSERFNIRSRAWDAAVAKPKDNLKVIWAMGRSLKPKKS